MHGKRISLGLDKYKQQVGGQIITPGFVLRHVGFFFCQAMSPSTGGEKRSSAIQLCLIDKRSVLFFSTCSSKPLIPDLTDFIRFKYPKLQYVPQTAVKTTRLLSRTDGLYLSNSGSHTWILLSTSYTNKYENKGL